jgi:hypothetical protein
MDGTRDDRPPGRKMTFKMNNIQNKLSDPRVFTATLFEKMKRVDPAIADLEMYEFCYALDNIRPETGWQSVETDSQVKIESMMDRRDFFMGIQLKPRLGEKIVVDGQIVALARMIFKGLVEGKYPSEWVTKHFYFDIRGFIFLPRTKYFTDQVLSHFGGKPFRSFEPGQKRLLKEWQIGYREFKELNEEIDAAFIESMLRIAEKKALLCSSLWRVPPQQGRQKSAHACRRHLFRRGKRSPPLKWIISSLIGISGRRNPWAGTRSILTCSSRA